MSDEIPEREEIVRSTIITVFFAIILLIFGLALWAWSAPDVIDTSLVGSLNAANPFLVPIIEIFTMFGMFVFLTVTAVNLRLYLTQIRSGWLEIIILLVVVCLAAYFMYSIEVAVVTVLLSMAFIVYLYLLQE
ncbi:MAG: hypothetical protein EAX81_02205 [Candidatus Thorarchaeota archaeon]|nr:hypothetical protein [Candidatus Thorarchaeota archaeon]